MSQTDAPSLLRRLARPADAAAEAAPLPPPSPARVLRHSVARAAEGVLGQRFTVLGVGDEAAALDEALVALPAGWMLVALQRGGQLTGLAALDAELRAALVELQTLGALRPAPAEERPVTATDAALAVPFLEALLADVAETAEGSGLDGWTAGVEGARRLDGPEAAALVLEVARYRTVRLTLELGAGGREGGLHLLLPETPEPEEPEGVAEEGPRLRETVLSAPAELVAILARVRLPFARVEGFAIGDVVPLDGVTVGSVRLEGPGGGLVTRGRLGQSAGLRAVRIEEPEPPSLGEALGGARDEGGGDEEAGPTVGTEAEPAMDVPETDFPVMDVPAMATPAWDEEDLPGE